MSFEANKLPEFEHKISDLPDQPNMQPNELKAYFDANPELLAKIGIPAPSARSLSTTFTH